MYINFMQVTLLSYLMSWKVPIWRLILNTNSSFLLILYFKERKKAKECYLHAWFALKFWPLLARLHQPYVAMYFIPIAFQNGFKLRDRGQNLAKLKRLALNVEALVAKNSFVESTCLKAQLKVWYLIFYKLQLKMDLQICMIVWSKKKMTRIRKITVVGDWIVTPVNNRALVRDFNWRMQDLAVSRKNRTKK